MFDFLVSVIPGFIFKESRKEKIISVTFDNLFLTLFFLRNNIFTQFRVLTCISGIDFLGLKNRFCVVYELLSLVYNCRLRVKVFLGCSAVVSSVCSIYINANWWEREIWDMFGIFFQNHPDLRRILTDYGFEGFPLRKDFPVCGFIDLRYDANKRLVCSEPIDLAQDFRFFIFENQW